MLLSGCAGLGAPSGPEVEGLGATQEKWNSLHSEDTRGPSARNVAYDRDPKYAAAGDALHDTRFFSAMWIGDPKRLWLIRMRETSGTSPETALADALKLLPSDVRVIRPLRVKDICAMETLESRILEQAFNASGVQNGGTVAILLSSGRTADHYDANSVTDVLIAYTFGDPDPPC